MNKHQRSIQKCARKYASYQLISYEEAKSIILRHHRSGGWPEVEKVMNEVMMSAFSQGPAARQEEVLRNELERLEVSESVSRLMLVTSGLLAADMPIDIAIRMARGACRRALKITRARIEQIRNELHERSQRKQKDNLKEAR